MRRTQPLGPAEHAILGLLYQSPSHGYELAEWFGPEGDFGEVCRVHPSLLYAHLKSAWSPSATWSPTSNSRLAGRLATSTI